jgi:hypothetical protein
MEQASGPIAEDGEESSADLAAEPGSEEEGEEEEETVETENQQRQPTAAPQTGRDETEATNSNDVSATEGIKHKKQRATMKSMWIITYGASSPYINPSMLRDLGKLEADECHSTKERVMAFTYLHLTKRVRQSTIENFMKRAHDEHGIVQNEIFGYDSIAGNTKQGSGSRIEEHIGFKMLVRHYLSNNAAFQPCTDGEPVLKRGNILKAAEIDPSKPAVLERKSKAQVLEYAKQLESRLKDADKKAREYSTRYDNLSSEHARIRVDNAMLRSKVTEVQSTNTNLYIENATLKRKITDLETGRNGP